MKNYTFSNEEYDAVDKLLDRSGLRNVIQITSYKKCFDCFWDYDESKRISIKEGLQIIYESNANEICFENGDVNKEEYEIVNQLFKKFGIGEWKNMFIVGIYYSFDSEMPMYIFDTEEEAKDFIKQDFEEEMRIQQESRFEVSGGYNDGFANLYYADGSFIEWNIGTVKNR